MGRSVDVNTQNYSTAVVDASFECPVVVDFFATWCGPCQMLKPVLETLSQEYEFVLAKVDIDQNPELAQSYQIEGVPDVRIVVEGQVRPGFVGFLPEPQIRELLGQLGLQSALDRSLLQVQAQVEAGALVSAQTEFEHLLQQYPRRPEVLVRAAEFYQNTQDWDKARDLLEQVEPTQGDWYQKATALKGVFTLQGTAAEPSQSDLDRQFQEAATAALNQEYDQSLEILLKIVGSDRSYRKDGARKMMITLFDILGDDHELTRQYRKKLTRMLY